MHADSAFIRRLTTVRDRGEAWKARVRDASARREGLGASLTRLLIAIPALVVVGVVLLVALAIVIAFGAVAIAVGLVAGALHRLRRMLGSGPLTSGVSDEAHSGRVNVRVIRRP